MCSRIVRRALLGVGLVGLLGLAACDDDDPFRLEPDREDLTALAYLRQSEDFVTLQLALVDAGLSDTLAAEGPFTVFAPPDAAFRALDLLALREDEALLAQTLQYHVVEGAFPVSELQEGQILTTLSGAELPVRVDGDTVRVGGAQVTTPDVVVANGVVHVVDRVLLGSSGLVTNAALLDATGALAAALRRTGLAEDLQPPNGPFTLFAPVDEAFAALDAAALQAEDNTPLLASVLQYHVVPGTIRSADILSGAVTEATTVQGATLAFGTSAEGQPTVDGVPIATADLDAANGVLHLIGEVLFGHLTLPERLAFTTTTDSTRQALAQTGLAETLREAGPFTVFAPVDEAFEGLQFGELLGTADPLLADAPAKLLRHHVLAGEALTTAALDEAGGPVTRATLQDVPVELARAEPAGEDAAGYRINGIPFVAADREAANGVLHLIDGVLLEALTVTERVAITEELSTLQTGLERAGLNDELDGGGPFTVFAPDDAAFSALPSEDFLALFEDPVALARVLGYHVVFGERLRAEDVQDGQEVRTLQGGSLTLGRDDEGNVTVNGVLLRTPNLPASNGVLHVLDGMLTPPPVN